MTKEKLTLQRCTMIIDMDQRNHATIIADGNDPITLTHSEISEALKKIFDNPEQDISEIFSDWGNIQLSRDAAIRFLTFGMDHVHEEAKPSSRTPSSPWAQIFDSATTEKPTTEKPTTVIPKPSPPSKSPWRQEPDMN